MHGKNRPIVVGIDREGSAVALVWAAREAALDGRPLRLVYAKTDPYASLVAGYAGLAPPDPGGPAPVNAIEVLTRAVDAVHIWQPDVPVTAYTELGDPAHVMIEQARTAAMIVLGRHRTGPLENLLAGSITGTVTGHAACPVVTVTAQPTWPDAPIVVAADGTPTGAQAIRLAFGLAARRAAPLHVQHVPRHRWQRATPDDSATRIAAQVADCTARVAPGDTPLQVTVRRSPGDPVDALVEAAGDAQLVVVGTRVRGSATGLLTGSIAQALLHRAPCPVVVIRKGCPAIFEPSES